MGMFPNPGPQVRFDTNVLGLNLTDHRIGYCMKINLKVRKENQDIVKVMERSPLQNLS